MKKLLLMLIFSEQAAFAKAEFPIYGYMFSKGALVLQVSTCKNRETTANDLFCYAYAKSSLEEGTGTIKKVVEVSCSAANDDDSSWCKPGDKHLAFGKTISIPFNEIKAQLSTDPREAGDNVAKFIDEDYDVRFVPTLIVPTPTKERFIDEP